MQVIHWGRARQFIKLHPDSEVPLKSWRRAVQAAEWTNFPDIKKTFNSADWAEGKIIFDFKGNDYRLIAIASFDNHRLYIHHVLTHKEYDSGNWKK